MSRILLESLNKKFSDHTVLHSVDLSVAEGEMVALVGPSGSGKTTTLNLIAGLLEPSGGTISFDGSPVNGLPTRERGAVVVFQDYSLFPHMSVIDNIAFGLKMRGISAKERVKRAEDLLGIIQLEGHARKFPGELSGGQRQRVAIARALAVEPRVLLLDEPFSNLDSSLKGAMRDFVREIQKRMGITCIFVTHDTEDALMVADRIAVLFDGRIEQYDAPRVIYHSPATKNVADFFGAANYETVKVSGGYVVSSFGKWATHLGYNSEAQLMARPEAVKVSDYTGEGVRALVSDVVFCGGRTHYELEVGGSRYSAADSSRNVRNRGDTVALSMDIEVPCLFDPASGKRL